MRGSMADVVALPVIFLVITIPLVVALFLLGPITERFVNMGVNSHVFDRVRDSINIMIDSTVLVYFLLMLVSVILAYFSPSHPAFFPFSIFFALIGTVVAYIVGQFFTKFVVQLGATGVAVNSLLFNVVPYLPHLTILTWFLIAVVMYGNIKAYREGVL